MIKAQNTNQVIEANIRFLQRPATLFFIVLSNIMNIYATDCRTLDAVCFQAMDGKLMVNSLD